MQSDSNQNTIEGIQTSLFTVSAVKPMSVATSASISRRSGNDFKSLRPSTRAAPVMNAVNPKNTARFSNAGQQLGVSASNNQFKMRASSTEDSRVVASRNQFESNVSSKVPAVESKLDSDKFSQAMGKITPKMNANFAHKTSKPFAMPQKVQGLINMMQGSKQMASNKK